MIFNALDTALQAERLIRENHQKLLDFADNSTSRAALGDHSFLGITTAGDAAYPTVAQAIYYVNSTQIDVGDAEADTPTYTDEADENVPCLNVGDAVPPEGTRVIVTSVGGRLCFRF